jgi:hypothetical protein
MFSSPKEVGGIIMAENMAKSKIILHIIKGKAP